MSFFISSIELSLWIRNNYYRWFLINLIKQLQPCFEKVKKWNSTKNSFANYLSLQFGPEQIQLCREKVVLDWLSNRCETRRQWEPMIFINFWIYWKFVWVTLMAFPKESILSKDCKPIKKYPISLWKSINQISQRTRKWDVVCLTGAVASAAGRGKREKCHWRSEVDILGG
jgi:hypothetical protein